MMNALCHENLHLPRRRLLGAGGALMLAGLARRLAIAAESSSDPKAPPPSLILLWMEGAPSQWETFNPHAGTKYGGEVRAVSTSAKDLEIADTLPQTAERMHFTTLVRSMVGQEGDHERGVYQIKNGYRPDPTLAHPSIGAVLCHADNAGADIPRHVSILPGGSPGRGGFLGAKFDAFKTYDPRQPVPDVVSKVEEKRAARRLADLETILEPQFARGRMTNLETNRTLHLEGTASARRMMSSDQLAAFDVTQEPKSEQDRFGDTSFGRGVLAATRLIEVGVRCVEVTLGGWDSHVNNHSLQSSACQTLDPALAALLDRLSERGLLDSTIVVCGGEFGRTPQINPAGGRDHWVHGFSTLIAGGRFRRGHVHGETNPLPNFDQPGESVSAPVSVANLHATLLTALGIDPGEELQTPIGRPLKRSEGDVVKTLLS